MGNLEKATAYKSCHTYLAAMDYNQSHYIEVAQGAIFMGQIRFGLILGRLTIFKKNKLLSVRTKKLHDKIEIIIEQR